MGHLGDRAGFHRYAREVRADHEPVAGDLSLHIADFPVVAGGCDPQHLEPFFGPGIRADAAQRQHDYFCVVPDTVLRSARNGARLGGAGGWTGTVALSTAAPEKDRHAGVAAPEPARQRRLAGDEADVAGDSRGIGEPDLADHQYDFRFVPGRRFRVLDVLRRPFDGVAIRRVGRGAGDDSAADSGQDLRQQGSPRILAHPRLGPASMLRAGIALRLRAGDSGRAVDGFAVPVRPV
ncbi:hypothetical protein D3C76_952760 [compost metagenome]